MKNSIMALCSVLLMLFCALTVQDVWAGPSKVQVVTGLANRSCLESKVVAQQRLSNGGQCYFNRFVDVDKGFEDPKTFMAKKKKKVYKAVRKVFQKSFCQKEDWPGGSVQAAVVGEPYCVPQEGDGCIDPCRELSTVSEKGCVWIEGCGADGVEEESDEIESGDFTPFKRKPDEQEWGTEPVPYVPAEEEDDSWQKEGE